MGRERERQENSQKNIDIIKQNLPKSFKVDEIELKKIKESNHDKCIICYDDFRINDDVLYLDCLHSYHEECIIKWFLEKNKCPICQKLYYFQNNVRENIGQENDEINIQDNYNRFNNPIFESNDNINGYWEVNNNNLGFRIEENNIERERDDEENNEEV